MIDKARIKTEAEAFFEWPSKDKMYVTTTSIRLIDLLNRIFTGEKTMTLRDTDTCASLTREAFGIRSAPPRNPQRELLGRCLSVISTLEGEDTTEQEMLEDLKRDIKQAMGISPLEPGTLI